MESVCKRSAIDSCGIDPCIISPLINSFDDYGFAVSGDKFLRGFERRRCHVYKQKADVTCEQAWQDVIEDWDSLSEAGVLSLKLDVLMKNSTPESMRSDIWSRLLAADQMKDTSEFNYQVQCSAVRDQLVDLGISEYSTSSSVRRLSEVKVNETATKKGHLSLDVVRHIFLDLDRTFPTHRSFMGDSAEAVDKRASLFHILACYAHYNINVGYCQGMSSIAGVLLMYMHEELAFWCFVSLLHRHKYQLASFEQPMRQIQKQAAVFDHLLQKRYPKLYKHLTVLGVNSLMYIPSWFLCLFTGLSCWDTVLGVWDAYILHGKKSVFCVALSILSVLEDDLLAASDMSSVLPLLLHPPPQKVCYKSLLPRVWSMRVEDCEVDGIHHIPEAEEVGAKKRKRHNTDDTDERNKRKKADDSWLAKVRNAFRAPWRTNKDTLKRNFTAKHRRQSMRLARRHLVGKKETETSPMSPFTEIAINSMTSLSSTAAAYSFKTFHMPTPLRQNQKSRTAFKTAESSSNSPQVELQLIGAKSVDDSSLLVDRHVAPVGFIDDRQVAARNVE